MNYTSRFMKCREYMAKERLDVSIAISPENVLYFSEAYIMTQKDLRERLAIAVMPLESDPVMIACVVESHTVEDETWIGDKRYYVEFKQSPMQFLADALKEKGLDKKRVGIELNYLMAHYYQELVALLPNTEFVLCTAIFDKVRMIKDSKEIALLGNAHFQTRKAFEAAVLMTRPGDLETQLGKRTVDNLLALGADKLDFLCLASGERSQLVHGMPAEVPLVEGEVLRIDFGGVYKNYLSDIARTACVGRCNPVYEDTFNRLRQAYVDTFSFLRAGIAANEVFNEASKNYQKAGIPFRSGLVGHGIGLGPHEMPVLSPTETQVLQEDMIICFELSVHKDDRRFHIEDLVHITKDGPKILSEHTLAPRLLRVE